MIKKIILSVIFIAINLNAANNKYYTEYINKYINKEKNLINSVYNYLYNTGDTDITRYKLSKYFNYSSEFFTNLNNEKCNLMNSTNYCDNNSGGIIPILDTSNYTLTLKNHYNLNKSTDQLINNYKNSPFLPSNFILSGNDLKIILKPEIVKYITTINNLKETGIYISNVPPIDNKIYEWVKPNLNGILSLYLKNNDNKWLHVYDLNKNILNFDIYINKNSNIDINLIKLPENSKIGIYDDSTQKVEKFLFSGENWLPISETSDFDIWTGDSDIYDLSCIIFDKPSKSEAKTGTADPYITEPQTFIKYDDFDLGYWNSNKYYIVNSLSTLQDLSFKLSGNEIAYKCSDDTLKYDTLYNINNYWVYLINNYQNIFYYNTKPNEEKNVLTWNLIDSRDNDLKRIFKGETINGKTIWKSKYLYNEGNLINDETYEIAENRTDFNSFSFNKFYLTKNNDCITTGNCNGSDQYNHSGWKIDDMYVWIYDGNRLIDAYPVNNYREMYEGSISGKNAYFLTTDQNIYIKDKDINNHIIYRKKDDGSFWTAEGQKIPNIYVYNGKATFPKAVLTDKRNTNDEDISAVNVNFLNNILVLSDKIRMIEWKENINTNTPVIVNGNTGTYIFKGSYWINEDTKEILSGYTRKELPIATGSTYTYLTLFIGCDKENSYDNLKECRYTDDGIKNSYEDELYQWYYAVTPKSVNNLVDVVQLNSVVDLYSNTPEIGYVDQLNTIFMKKLDVNGNVCYYKLNNTDVILKNGKFLPYLYTEIDSSNQLTKIDIPTNKTCSNMDIDGNSIVFGDRRDLYDWNNLKENYSAKLLINNDIYTVRKNFTNNKFYFENSSGNEFLGIDKSIFDGIVYYEPLTYKKYITLELGNRTLYNGGLQIKDYLTTPVKIDGIFSEDDKQLFVWFANPVAEEYQMDSLVDILLTDDIEKVYDLNMEKVIYESSLYGPLLLNKDKVNNEVCYVSKPVIEDTSSYDYILKSTGEKSLTKNNLPLEMNCLNSKFYNNSLIVPNMIIAINWNTAEEGFSTILPDLNEKNKYVLVKYNDKFYWINDPDLNKEFIYDNEPNKIYALDRSKIDTIPLSNLGLRAYTININEDTNTKLSSEQTYYEWLNYKNLDTIIQGVVYETGNLTDYIKPIEQINNNLFVDVKNVSKNIEYTNIIPNIPEFKDIYKLHINKNIDDLNCNDILKIAAFTSSITVEIDNSYPWSKYINDYLNNKIVVINETAYEVITNNILYQDNILTISVVLKNTKTEETKEFYYEYPNHQIEFKAYSLDNTLLETRYRTNNQTIQFTNKDIAKISLNIIPVLNSENNCKISFSFNLITKNMLEDIINNCPENYLYYDNSKCYRDSYIITHFDNSIEKIYNMNEIIYNINTKENSNYIKSYSISNNEYLTTGGIYISDYPIGTLIINELTGKKFFIIFNTLKNKYELKIF